MRRNLRPLLLPCLAVILILTLSVWQHAAAQEQPLPIPRFVSLKSDEVNLRTGPGTRYPISWVYRRAGWPMKVVQEYESWRQLEDYDGARGWVHKNLLTGARNGVIQQQDQLLRTRPTLDAPAVARLKPLVKVELLRCDLNWCMARVDNYKGWLPKTIIWGVLPHELIEE
jgi:SH3-like domain-containing protein